MKKCTKCGVEKGETAFAKHAAAKDGLQAKCRECMSAYHKALYANNPKRKQAIDAGRARSKDRNRAAVREFLEGKACVDCGFDNPIALQFDHIDPDQKFSEVSNMRTRGFSLERLFEEIAKCEIRCANCHLIKHANLRQAG